MQLPPLQVTRAVIQRYARLLHRYDSELGERPLVVPSSEFFPDEFLGDEESVKLLAARMMEHAGLADIPVDARVVNPATPESQMSGCSTGGCGVPVTTKGGFARLVEQGETWLLQVPAQELRHPVVLTTNLARSIAFVFLVETQREGELMEPPVDVTADLIAVALGFGPLMLQGSYIYAKSCSGPQIARVTKVGLEELSVAVALFAALGKHRIPQALRHLDVTQQALLKEAADLLAANKGLIEQLRRNPDAVSRQDFSLDEPGTFVTHWLGKWGKRKGSEGPELHQIDPNMDLDEVEDLLMEMPPSSQAGRTSRPPPPADPKRDELKELVSEALHHARV